MGTNLYTHTCQFTTVFDVIHTPLRISTQTLAPEHNAPSVQAIYNLHVIFTRIYVYMDDINADLCILSEQMQMFYIHECECTIDALLNALVYYVCATTIHTCIRLQTASMS